MTNINFNLDKPNAAQSYVLLKFSFKGKRFRYSIGLKIPPSHWNSKKQRLKEMQDFPINKDHNVYLSQIEKETFNFYRSYLDQDKTPSLSDLKNHLNIYRGKTAKPKEESFFGFIERLIHERSGLPDYKPTTISAYKTARSHIKDYCTKKTLRSFDFESVDIDFFNGFTSYLYNKKGFSQNYVHKIIKTLKTFLNDASAKGIKVNPIYKTDKFHIKQTEAYNIYLSIEDLNTIYQLDLSEQLGLDRVRDLFLIGAFTGLRFSDFSKLKKEHFKTIDNTEVVAIKTQKTGGDVVIPLHPIVKAILAKYNGLPPKAISNQKTNVALKKIARLAGFTEMIVVTENVGGINRSKEIEKYKLVSSHTARRSFATNAFKAGIPSISIMKITDHKKESSFLKYIKIDKEENAVLMAQNPFFKMSPLKKAN